MGGIDNRTHRLKKELLKTSSHVQFVFHKHESYGKSQVQFLIKILSYSFSASLNLTIGGLE